MGQQIQFPSQFCHNKYINSIAPQTVDCSPMSDDKYQQITNMKPDIIRSEPFSPIIVVKVLSWTFFRFEFFSRVVPPDNFQVEFFSLSPNIVVVSQRKQENRNGVSNKSLFL